MFTNAEKDILADEALLRKRAAAAKKKAARSQTAAIAQATDASLLQEGVPPLQRAPQGSAATPAGAEGDLSLEQYTHHLRTSALVHHSMHPLNPATSHLSANLSNRVKGLDAQFEALKRGERPNE